MQRRNFRRYFALRGSDQPVSGNPLFPKKAPAARGWRYAILGVVVVSSVIAAGVGGLSAEILRLRGFTLTGVETLPVAELEANINAYLSDKSWFVVPNDHRWLFATKRLHNQLMSSFPLKSASIERDGSQLLITIQEDVFMLALRTPEQSYFLTRTGLVSRIATPEEQSAIAAKLETPAGVVVDGNVKLPTDLPIIRSKAQTSYEPNAIALSETKVQELLALHAGLQAMGFRPREYVSDDLALPWLAITTERDYLILVDITRSASEQLMILQAVVEELETSGDTPSYIDLRFGTRVFIR